MALSQNLSEVAPVELLELDQPSGGTGEAEASPPTDRLWIAVRRMPKYLKLAVNLLRDDEVPPAAKGALAAGGIYSISPVDLVPGFIPVLGQLDDIVVLLVSIRLALRTCPPDVAAAQLERVGLEQSNFDDDLVAVKDTTIWLAKKGLRASQSLATKGGRRMASLWRERVRPVSRWQSRSVPNRERHAL
jgi:uncharacterized membrane protein YkvA (DUF1232 family)